jgi:hypothetical protein
MDASSFQSDVFENLKTMDNVHNAGHVLIF